MKKITSTLVVMSFACAAVACDKQATPAESPESADAEEGPMEEAGEWTDEAAEDTADAAEDAADETGEAFDEAGSEIEDETDGNPATD